MFQSQSYMIWKWHLLPGVAVRRFGISQWRNYKENHSLQKQLQIWLVRGLRYEAGAQLVFLPFHARQKNECTLHRRCMTTMILLWFPRKTKVRVPMRDPWSAYFPTWMHSSFSIMKAVRFIKTMVLLVFPNKTRVRVPVRVPCSAYFPRETHGSLKS